MIPPNSNVMCFIVRGLVDVCISGFPNRTFQKISDFLRESPRSSFFLAVIVLPAGLDLSRQIETEQ